MAAKTERSEARWTPGPWVARPAATERTHPISADVRGPHGQFIADCGSHEHATADARLIAAAPDLVEALNMLLDAFVVDNAQMTVYQSDAADKAWAALSRAGSQP